ncbi:glycoside hydrolase family 32 protein [Vibrio ishigakensis]|nr:sucrose-6-phosphate hydrolase [Vibrio ishigakensis]
MLSADQIYINNVLAKSLNQKDTYDPYRPLWHFSPQFGLLNDPNGLAHFNGEFHLFYQWNPLACEHGAKAWGHATSKDLLSWQHQPLALAPTQDFETHGCYSGSAIEVDGVLELFYTGNVKFEGGDRTAYQCRATLESGSQVEKKGIVLELPSGYSGHVRDPKVWKHADHYYMVLGAEDLDYKGKVIAYRSTDLNNWQLVGEVFGDGLNGLNSDDFMLECPDLFPLQDQHVLVSCPKNWIDVDGRKVETFDVTYHLGDFDYQTGSFGHGEGTLMDHGFDFYAPQTFEDDAGRRILFGWMGKPDEFEPYQPTIAHGWIHQMTCARELIIQDGKLKQAPVSEIKQMRAGAKEVSGSQVVLSGVSSELELNELLGKQLSIKVSADLEILVDGNGLTTHRRNLKTGEIQSLVWQGEVEQLQLLRDASSIEVFINRGEGVATSRFFETEQDAEYVGGFKLESESLLSGQFWQLRAPQS